MNGPRDIEVLLPNEPGALADFAQALGRAGVSLDGGGVFAQGSAAIAHFLVVDADAAKSALESAGVGPVTIAPVIMLRLDQETPGQLGAFTRRLGDNGVNILVQYSDHDGNLIIVTDPGDHDRAAVIAHQWMDERAERS